MGRIVVTRSGKGRREEGLRDDAPSERPLEDALGARLYHREERLQGLPERRIDGVSLSATAGDERPTTGPGVCL